MEESKSVIVVIAASGLTPEDVIADIFLENGVLKSIDRGVGLDIKIEQFPQDEKEPEVMGNLFFNPSTSTGVDPLMAQDVEEIDRENGIEITETKTEGGKKTFDAVMQELGASVISEGIEIQQTKAKLFDTAIKELGSALICKGLRPEKDYPTQEKRASLLELSKLRERAIADGNKLVPARQGALSLLQYDTKDTRQWPWL